MGLTARLARAGFRRPHVLLLLAPGAVAVRLQAERFLRESGWPGAASAADADLLVVCGDLDAQLEEVAGRVMSQMPLPRLRVDILAAQAVESRLREARNRLIELAPEALADLPGEPGGRSDTAGMDMAGSDTADSDMAGMDTAGSDTADSGMAGMDTADSDMDGMDMDGMDGMAPGGLAMADRAPDRDGLKLDVLHVALGPVLPDWPAGLRLQLLLQGDVIQEARVECLGLGNGVPAYWEQPGRRAAAHLDSLSRLLGVAGFYGPRLRCQLLRDRLLDGEPAGEVANELARLRRWVLRSRVLSSMTDRVGVLTPEQAAQLGAPAVGGDVSTRLRAWLDGAQAALAAAAGSTPYAPEHAEPQAVLDLLPELLVGAEWASARLMVASLDPDLGRLVGRPRAEALVDG